MNAQAGANTISAQREGGILTPTAPVSYSLAPVAVAQPLPPQAQAPLATVPRVGPETQREANKVWGACVFSNARKLAINFNESAEAVVTASLSRCFELERAFDAAWQARWNTTGEAARSREEIMRPLATDVVVTIRARRKL